MRPAFLVSFALLIVSALALFPAPGSGVDGKDRPLDRQDDVLVPWWQRTTMDKDGNGIADTLDSIVERGDRTDLSVIVSFSRDIGADDITSFGGRGLAIGASLHSIDAIVLPSVPSNRLYDVFNVEGVVFVEPIGSPMLFSDVATPTVRARGSEVYSPYTAWEEGSTGKGVSLAVIDTGIDDEHPSLRGKFLAGVDMTKPDNLRILYPQDGTYNPDDIQGHGSTCSGIATGTGAPEGAYMGAAPDARLVDIRIGTKIGYAPGEFWVGAIGDPQLKDGTLRGIQWGIENAESSWSSGGADYQGIDVFSISWGVDVGMDSDGTDAYSRLLDAAVERGVIVVNAAGNDGPSNTGFTGLSASSKAIIVAATDDYDTLYHEDDTIAEYSSRGPRTDNGDGDPYDELKPDIAAPGTHINNLQPDTTRIMGDASSNGYGARGSGTSYATPLVAGVVALMLEANPLLEGENDLVKEILRYTAERRAPPTLPDLDPFWERDHGWGTVDAYSAVKLAREVTDPSIIDPDLQAHILSPAQTNFSRVGTPMNMTDHIVVEGLGWSRGGDFEKTQYRIDDRDWIDVDVDATDENGSAFNPFTIHIKGLAKGDHRIWVRSVAGNMESLPDWIDVNVVSEEGEGAVSGGTMLIVLGIASALAAAAVGYFYLLRKRSLLRDQMK